MNPLLLPAVAAQALWLRSTITLLPEATGPATGHLPGTGTPLRVAVLGESTAAGCGVDRHDQGFAAALAAELAAATTRPVHWQTVGRLGATARRIRHRLLPQLPDDLDVAVVLAGVNDVLTGRAPAAWREDLAGILTDLTGRARRTLVAGLPPFTRFPALPALLGRYLAERATLLDAVARHECARDPARTTWFPALGHAPPDFFAADRFHPGQAGYRHWAHLAATHLDPTAQEP